MSRVVAENCAIVGKIQLQVVCTVEALSVDWLRHEGADIVIVSSMFAMESCTRRLNAFACNLELKNHLFWFSCCSQEEAFFAMAPFETVLEPILILCDIRHMRNNERAVIITLRVVDVHHQVSHLASNKEIFAHCHLHRCCLARYEANFFVEWHDQIKLRVVDDRANWWDMNTLSVADLGLAPRVV